jgi:hypothetical protein
MVKNILRSLLLRINAGNQIFVLGDGRSGTTWIAAVLNFDGRYLNFFEPFHGQRILGLPDKRIYPTGAELGVATSGAFDFKKYVKGSKIFAGQEKPTGLALSGCLIKDVTGHLILSRIKDSRRKDLMVIRHPFSVALSKEGYGKWHSPQDLQRLISHSAEVEKLYDICKAKKLLGSRFLEYVLVWCLLHRSALSEIENCEKSVLFYEEMLLEPEASFKSLFDRLELGEVFNANREKIMHAVIKRSRTTSVSSRIEASLTKAQPWLELKSGLEINNAYGILKVFGLWDIYGKKSVPQISTADLANLVGDWAYRG